MFLVFLKYLNDKKKKFKYYKCYKQFLKLLTNAFQILRIIVKQTLNSIFSIWVLCCMCVCFFLKINYFQYNLNLKNVFIRMMLIMYLKKTRIQLFVSIFFLNIYIYIKELFWTYIKKIIFKNYLKNFELLKNFTSSKDLK